MQFKKRLNSNQPKIEKILFPGNDFSVRNVSMIYTFPPIPQNYTPFEPVIGPISYEVGGRMVPIPKYSSPSNLIGVFENFINLTTLSFYNPDKFNYNNNICKLLKNIKLSEIKISETEFFNSNFFITLNDGEIFDGKNCKILIDIDNYCGLFKFPSFINPLILPEILNLNIQFNNNLNEYGGGIVASQSYYFLIKNCNTYGNLVKDFSSGIIGSSSGNFIIKNSNFYGDIECLCGSGIVGAFSTWLTELCIIENCKYIGNIKNYFCSGIIGILSGYLGGNVCILNCASKCNILKDSYFGGIVGTLCGYEGLILIYNSLLEGNIGDLDGRIVGPLYGRFFDTNGENSLLYLINIKDDLSNIGYLSNTEEKNIINIKKNNTIYINSYIFNPYENLVQNINPIRLIKFAKIKNAKYYIIKRYYNDDKNTLEIIDKLCGCEDLIFDLTYDLSANKVTYLVEAYDCKNKIHTQKFVY